MIDSKDNEASSTDALARARALLASLPQPEQPQRKPRSQSSGEPNLLNLTLRAEAIAAVSGALEPASLLASVNLTLGEGRGRALLNALAPSFHVEVKSGKTWWSLHSEPRAEILEEVDERSLDFSKLPETDDFGKMLRRVLDPKDHLTESVVNGLEADQLLALIAATEAVPGDQIEKPDLGLLHARLSRLRLENAGKTLVKNFVGRTEELERLREFLAKPSNNLWSGLLVTGLGGAGKSTLVAKFVAEAREKKLATAVVLDFDRPGIDPRDAPALEIEIARLVGMDRPELEPRLRKARDEDWVRRLRAGAEQRSTSEDRETELAMRSLSAVGDTLRGLPQPAAVLLVLDTFEEVTQLGFLHKLLDWLTRVADRLSPLPLKVLISGRLFDADTTLGAGLIEKEPLHLDELTDDSAIELLRQEVASSSEGKVAMPEAFARELVADKLIPKRPLELKLVARMYQDSPDELEQLKHDLREGGEKLRALFAGLVYRRILTRMKGASDTVKALAFPGLVLRYVTPELIRSVLVPCLGLQKMTLEEAQDALNSLAKYSWFTQRDTTGELRYRRDLRRATLKVARAQEAEATRRIHEAAIEWFGKPEHAQLAEVLYHQLMLLDDSQAEVDLVLMRDLPIQARNLRSDIEDLPSLGEALLLFAAEEPLRVDQIVRLPWPYREAAYRNKGNVAAQAGEYGLALQMYEPLTKRNSSQGPLERWEMETLFASARWVELARRRQELRLLLPTDWREFVVGAFTGSVLESAGFQRFENAQISPKVLEELGYRTEAISNTDLSRMAFASALRDVGPAIPAWQSLLEQLWRFAERADDGTRNGQWAGRLGLLRMLGRRSGAWAEVLLGTPISVNPAAHLALLETTRGLVHGYDDRLAVFLGEMARIVNEGVRGRWTARSILAGINSLAGFAPTCLEGMDLRLPHGGVVTHGPVSPLQAFDSTAAVDPEFRDPVRFALRDAFADDQDTLRQLLASVVPFHLDDLDPEGFQRELSGDSEHALHPQIELVDRCGATGQLLKRARELRPGSEKLRLVTEAHTQWRAALRRLFELSESREPEGEVTA